MGKSSHLRFGISEPVSISILLETLVCSDVLSVHNPASARDIQSIAHVIEGHYFNLNHQGNAKKTRLHCGEDEDVRR